jgi:hypothetical protein
MFIMLCIYDKCGHVIQPYIVLLKSVLITYVRYKFWLEITGASYVMPLNVKFNLLLSLQKCKVHYHTVSTELALSGVQT